MSEETIALRGDCVRLYIEGALCATSSIDITYNITGPPTLVATMPATAEIVSVVRPRLKVHCVFMDFTYSPAVPTLFFEGEIIDHGFSMTTQSRTFSITAVHITFPWQSVSINILKPEDFFSAQVRNTQTFQTLVPDVEGSIFSIFSPETVKNNLEKLKPELVKELTPRFVEDEKTIPPSIKDIVKEDINQQKIKKQDQDLYSYTINAAKFYHALSEVSPIKDGYDYKAMRTYKLYERIFFPSLGSMVNWETFFSKLLILYYMEILSSDGGSLSFLELIKQISAIVLQEMIILPNPKTPETTCILKPYLHFSPVPRCNYITPNFVNVLSWNETHTSKPTRLIQYSPPGIVMVDPDLAFQFKDIAPPELAEKFDLYNKVRIEIAKSKKTEQSDKEKKEPENKTVYDIHKETIDMIVAQDPNFSLVTEEEKRRGIVESTNNIPRHIMSAIELIYKREGTTVENSNTKTNKNSVKSGMSVTAIDNELKNSPGNQLQEYLTVAYRLKYFDDLLSKIIEKKTASPDLNTAFNSNNYFVLNSENMVFNIIWINSADFSRYKTNNILPHYYITANGDNIIAEEWLPRYYNLFQHSFTMPKIIPLKTEIKTTDNKTTKDGIFGSGGLIFVTDTADTNALNPTATVDVNASLKALKGCSFSNITIGINPIIWRGNISKTREVLVDLIIALYGLTEPVVTSVSKTNFFSYHSLDWSDTVKSTMGFNSDTNNQQQMSSFLATVDEEVKNGYGNEYQKFSKYLDESILTQGYEKAIQELNKIFKSGLSEVELTELLNNTVDKMKFNVSESGSINNEKSVTTVVTAETANMVKRNYSQPLCTFYFYYNRYASFNRSVYLVFNPYIVPGFPAFIQDRISAEEYPLHILGYVQQVQHSFTANSISTNVTLSNMRRIDDFSDTVLMDAARLASLQGQDLADIRLQNDQIKLTTVYDHIKKDFPFFGEEWSKYYNYTVMEALGIDVPDINLSTLKFYEIAEAPKKTFNFIEDLKSIRRKIQRVKIQGFRYKDNKIIYLNSTEIKNNLVSFINANKGSIDPIFQVKLNNTLNFIIQNESEFLSAPSKATFLYELNDNGFFVIDDNLFADDIIIDGIGFDSTVQNKIYAHTERCRNSNAQSFIL